MVRIENLKNTYAQPNAYPLVYIREHSEQRMLIILNPSPRAAEFSCHYKLKGAVYSYGEAAA